MDMIQDVDYSLIKAKGKPQKRVKLYDIMCETTDKIIPIVDWEKVLIKFIVSERYKEHGFSRQKKVRKVIGYRIKSKYGTVNIYG